MTAVERLDPARKALAEAESLPDVAALVDYAEAARQAARRAKLSEESQKAWAVFALEAQRKAGELLSAAPKSRGGRPGKTGDSVSLVSGLREVLGTKTDDEAKAKSSRWQKVAAVPQDAFDDYVTTAEEPSRAGLIKHAKKTGAVPTEDELLDAIEKRKPGSKAKVEATRLRSRFSKAVAGCADVPLMASENDIEVLAAALDPTVVGIAASTLRDAHRAVERIQKAQQSGLRIVKG